MGKFDDMSTEDLHRRLAGAKKGVDPGRDEHTELTLEIMKRDKDESKQRDEEMKKRHEEVSYRSWLSIFIALGSFLVSLYAAAKASG